MLIRLSKKELNRLKDFHPLFDFFDLRDDDIEFFLNPKKHAFIVHPKIAF